MRSLVPPVSPMHNLEGLSRSPAAVSPVAKPRVLMPILSLASFVQTDVRLLSERYDVELIDCRSAGAVLRTAIKAITADCVYCWFASTWFLPVIALARLLRKPVVIVCGGYDVANLPEIDYGNMRSQFSRWLGRLVLKGGSAIVPFSWSAYREARDNAAVHPSKLHMVYLAVDESIGEASVSARKAPVVLTVSNIDDSTLTRKGLMTVATVSRLLPDIDFVIVGRAEPQALARLKSAAGTNVRFTGFVDGPTLDQLMSTSKVIFQPSLHEGFGMSVAEAMLHGAIPVVSSRFSLPEVVGEHGFYGEPDNPNELAESVRRALAAGPELGAAARERVVSQFALGHRRRALLELMELICPTNDTSAAFTHSSANRDQKCTDARNSMSRYSGKNDGDGDVGQRERNHY